MRIFVTGATGFVGGELAKQLLADGHDLGFGIVLRRRPTH